MHNKIIGSEVQVHPSFEDLKSVLRNTTNLSSSQAEIATCVFGIIYSHVPIKNSKIALRKYFVRYVSTQTKNILAPVHEEINKQRGGKILERVIIEYLLNYQLGTTSHYDQDLHKGIDFIFKTGNIKIGTDITLVRDHKIVNIKKQRTINGAYLNDEKEKKYGVGREVDTVSMIQFNIPYTLQRRIYDGIQDWQQNNFHLHWKDYISGEWEEKIDDFFHSALMFLQAFFKKISEGTCFGTIDFSDGIWKGSSIYDQKTQIIEFIIQEKGYPIFILTLPCTQKLYNKLGFSKTVSHFYDPNIKKIPHYQQEDLKQKSGKNTTKTHPRAGYRRKLNVGFHRVDDSLTDIDTHQLLGDKHLHKLKK